MPKIVIDIPLGDYEWIKNHVMTVNEQAIANGKLLSEVLDEIKADIYGIKTQRLYDYVSNDRIIDTVIEIINKHTGKE